MRCTFNHNDKGPRCCLDEGHEGPHLFKCAGDACPGLSWPASVMPHPHTCSTIKGQGATVGASAVEEA